MSTESHETPGQRSDGLVWSSERPLYPARDALATFDLASEAVREYQRMLDGGTSEPDARRQAAQVGDGLNLPKQRLAGGLDSTALAGEAIARYRDHQTRGLDHSSAATEAAIDTSTAHTDSVDVAADQVNPRGHARGPDAHRCAPDTAAVAQPSGALADDIGGDRDVDVRGTSEFRQYASAFTDSYLGTLVWTGLDWSREDESGNPASLGARYTREDVRPETVAEAREECETFLADNWDDLAELEPQQTGQDFALTRNRHGAGFWDRGLGVRGDRLTAAAHDYGDADLDAYVDFTDASSTGVGDAHHRTPSDGESTATEHRVVDVSEAADPWRPPNAEPHQVNPRGHAPGPDAHQWAPDTAAVTPDQQSNAEPDAAPWPPAPVPPALPQRQASLERRATIEHAAHPGHEPDWDSGATGEPATHETPQHEQSGPSLVGEDAEARVDAAMRRAETAIDRADTELAAHQHEPTPTEPARAPESPGAETDRDMGQVSL